jgi:hypothetical protein
MRYLWLLLLIGCGQSNQSQIKEAMNSLNNPTLIPGIISNVEYTFSQLPEDGKVTRIWSGDWWPLSQKGTAARRYDNLSPIEKYDRATGGNQATQWELNSAAPYANSNWAGHCNGLAAAGMMNEQPIRSVIFNNVKFAIEDIKALLVESWQGSGRIVGDRCSNSPSYDRYGRIKESECRDTNPATFHLALANFLGFSGKSFAADIDPGVAVWNYPIINYKVENKRWLSKTEAISMLQDQNSVIYTYNIEATDFVYIKTSVTFINFDPKYYEYILEIDVHGKILDGEWLGTSKQNHPDFIWRPLDPQPENPHLDLKIIQDIYRLSL